MQERLQKLIAAAGLTSRRKAEVLIQSGLVTVNGQVVTKLGAKADPERDAIKVNGKLINPKLAQRKLVYYLLNKPKGYLSSLSDPEQRPLVTDLLPKNAPRVYPVGRLDFNTEGLLILTNDGALANIVTKAGDHCPKVYHVKVKGTPGPDQLKRLERGITIEGQVYRIARLTPLEQTDGGNAWFELVLHEGKNNQIRRMFDAIGHSVLKLRRVAIGHLTDAGLPVGAVRELTPAEVQRFFSKRKIVPPVTTRKTASPKLGKVRPAKDTEARKAGLSSRKMAAGSVHGGQQTRTSTPSTHENFSAGMRRMAAGSTSNTSPARPTATGRVVLSRKKL
jgi:23S rRNA pseudouridine2605 synthase